MKEYVPLLVELAIDGLLVLSCWYFYILNAERYVRKTGIPAMDKENVDKLRRNGKIAIVALAAGAVLLISQRFASHRLP